MSIRSFSPWIGRLYHAEGFLGKRLLILGESHYPADPAGSPEALRGIVAWALHTGSSRFHTRTQRIVVGGRGGFAAAQRADFWHRVAFYNYVQTAMTGPRKRPTPTMWSEAREPLLQTIRELEPQVMLVLGVELARNLPTEFPGIAVCRVPHPSSPGFKYEPWQSRFQATFTAPALPNPAPE